MVKSTGCSSKGPGFNSQHPHGGSQPQHSLTPTPGNQTPSSGFYVHQALPAACETSRPPWTSGMYTVHRHTHRQNTHTHKIIIQKSCQRHTSGYVCENIFREVQLMKKDPHHSTDWSLELNIGDQALSTNIPFFSSWSTVNKQPHVPATMPSPPQ